MYCAPWLSYFLRILIKRKSTWRRWEFAYAHISLSTSSNLYDLSVLISVYVHIFTARRSSHVFWGSRSSAKAPWGGEGCMYALISLYAMFFSISLYRYPYTFIYILRAVAIMFSADLGQAQKHLKEVRFRGRGRDRANLPLHMHIGLCIRRAVFFSIYLYRYPSG